MGIRIQHGDLGALADLARLAGEAKASQRQADRSHQAMMQAQRLQAQQAADIRRGELQQEMAVFDEEMKANARMQAQSWELEKMAIRSRMDFEQQERRRIMEDEEKQSKIKALEHAFDRGQITESELSRNILSVQLGHSFREDRASTKGGAIEDIYRSLISQETGNQPSVDASSSPGQMIEVVHIASGQGGRVPAHEFDPRIYTKVVNDGL